MQGSYLGGAAFLVRDARCPENITILEELGLPAAAWMASSTSIRASSSRAAVRMEHISNAMGSIPLHSLPRYGGCVRPRRDVLASQEEFEHQPPVPRRQVRGHAFPHMTELTLTPKAVEEMLKELVLTPESELDDKRIDSALAMNSSPPTSGSTGPVFAFGPWATPWKCAAICVLSTTSATLADLSSLRPRAFTTNMNLIKPLVAWLGSRGVRFQLQTQVENIEVRKTGGSKVADASS